MCSVRGGGDPYAGRQPHGSGHLQGILGGTDDHDRERRSLGFCSGAQKHGKGHRRVTAFLSFSAYGQNGLRM